MADTRRQRKNRYIIGMKVVAIVFALFFAGLARAGNDAPQIKQKAVIGNYLTDGKGMTFYYFKKDQKDKNSCTGQCLAARKITGNKQS